MNLQKMSSRELREYCIKHDLNFLEVLIQREEAERPTPKEKKKTKPKPKTPVKEKAKSPEEVVLKVLDEVRQRSSGKPVSLNEFSTYVEADLQRLDIEHGQNCSVENFVSGVLYRYAEGIKYSQMHWKEKIQNQVRVSDLENLLGVNFGEDFSRIAGILTPEQVRTNYSLNENGRFRNELGEYNMGGERCWNGQEKEKIRQTLAEMVFDRLVAERVDERNQKLRELEEERSRLKEDLKDLTKEEKDGKTKVKISGDPGLVLTIKRHFGVYLRNQGLIEKDKITEKVGAGKSDITFTVHNPEYLERFESHLKNYLGKNIRLKRDIKINRTQLGKSTERKDLESRLESVGYQEEVLNSERDSISYLGLEGANFASYLTLVDTLDDFGINFTAIIPEYDHRVANLMRSIKAAGISPALDGVSIEERSVDDLILLDFVKDPKFSIAHPRRQPISVEYGDELLNLGRYHELLDDLDARSSTHSHLATRYGVSQKFVAAASERGDDKFDVIFLDYVSGVSKKRAKAWETLVKRRTKDKPILAITSNRNPLRSHGGILAKKIPEFSFEKILEISEGADCEVEDFEHIAYVEGKNRMYFAAYHIKKNGVKK